MSHAALSPSSAYRWLNCSASVTVAPLTEPRSSKYAREGSFAHFVAEKILRDELFFEPTLQHFDGEKHVITPQLIEQLKPYTDLARGVMRNPTAQCVIEQKVVVPGTKDRVYGTADFAAWGAIGGVLTIMDLKFGTGVRVDPDTPQTALYALGAAAHFGADSDDLTVERVIVQPRGNDGLNPYRTAMGTLGELREWLEDQVHPAISHIDAGSEEENPGPWCRFCPRKPECGTLKRASVMKAFNDHMTVHF